MTNEPLFPDLQNHVALVTGSTAGLGKVIAWHLGKAGAKLALNYQHQKNRAEQTWQEFKQAGFEVVLVKADVTDEREVNQLYETVSNTLGAIDILVTNAAGDHPQVPFEEHNWEIFEQAIHFFIKSPYLLTKACLPAMKSQQWGRIITISSDVCFRNVNHYSAYVTAKQGQVGFTRSMATELAPFGITVNTIAPGWIPVERHEILPDFLEKKAHYETTRVPMKRVGKPEDVASAVLYFANEASSFVTGQYLCVNGGVSLM